MPGIYLQDGLSFIAMRERPYNAESVLQALIAEHPEMLAGDEDETSHGWLLVRREAAIPDAGGSDRWSLDHLFLDEDAVPTLVEVKRSSDTRTRREVVAQMLDYAANAAATWSADLLRSWFELQCQERRTDPTLQLEQLLGVRDEDAYWDKVRTNLAAERIRLVFVSDEIPPELRIIVEFLNRKMTETEVLAVEVKQYVDDTGGHQTIVPRLLGQTEATRETKGRRRANRQWDEESLLEDTASRHGDSVAGTLRSLIDWAKDRDDVRIEYGRGAADGSALIRLDRDGTSLAAFNLWSYGRVEIPFDFMQGQPPFGNQRDKRDELRRRINEAVPEARIPAEEERRRPSFRLETLGDEDARARFLGVIDWAMDQASAAQSKSLDSVDRPQP